MFDRDSATLEDAAAVIPVNNVLIA